MAETRAHGAGFGVINLFNQKHGLPDGKESGELDLHSLSLAVPSCEAMRIPRPALQFRV